MDLGPQVSYRMLCFWEDLGPLLLYPVFYFFPVVYHFFSYSIDAGTHHEVTYALYFWCCHYFKRIKETFLVHRFGCVAPCPHPHPHQRLPKLCLLLDLWVLHCLLCEPPLYTPVSDFQMKIRFGFGILCQILNFYCHIILRNLRSPDGNGGYQIPRGLLFNVVTCANYTTEIYRWLGLHITTQTVAGYVFLVVATFIMTN